MSSAAGEGRVPESTAMDLPGEGVVLVRSELTDVRSLHDWLGAAGIGYQEVVLNMGQIQQRRRFHALCAVTGWHTLPQIFVDGRFVGGERELRGQLDHQERPPQLEAGSETRVTRLLSGLGYLSLAPFVAALAGLLFASEADRAFVEQLLVGYGAVILSFLGAVHWGRMLDAEEEDRVPLQVGLLAVMPALVGWGTLLMPLALSLPLQAGLFVAIYVVDRVYLAHLPLGGWYVRLRNRLTTLAVLLVLASWLVVLNL